jgi:acetyl esterase/lipase
MLRAGTPADWSCASVDVRRAGFDGLMRFAAPPPSVGPVVDRVIEGPGGPLPLRVFSPEGPASRLPGLLYLHGGGLVAGSLESYDSLSRTLAAGIGCRLVAVGYRLAPEHPYPAAIEDAVAAVRHVLDHPADFGVDPARVAVGGDSAGGTLTAIVTQTLRDLGDVRLAAQVLLCPVLDFAEERPSKRAYGEGFLLDTAMMARDLVHYAPDVALTDPRLSPLRAKRFADLPPAIIHTAACDPLADEGLAYAEALRAAGVTVSHTCHPGMVHHFYGLTGLVPAARRALDAITAEVGAMFGNRNPP